jgi:hypothetical protein
MATVKQYKSRYGRMLTERSNVDVQNQAIAELFAPSRAQITQQRQMGDRMTQQLDSTGIFANVILAAALHSFLTNPSTKWASLKFSNQDLNDHPEARDFLEDAAERMLLGFRQSNFDAQVNESYLNLGPFGIGAQVAEEKDAAEAEEQQGFRGFRFESYNPGTYVLAENAQKRVDTVFHTDQMSVRAAADRFGENVLSDEARAALRKDEDMPLRLLHCVHPRRKQERGKTGMRQHPYASVWMEKDTDTKLLESGYNEFPFQVVRWSKVMGNPYGFGPGHIALSDVQTKNRARELGFRTWDKAIDPPMKVLDDGVLSDVDIRASGLTVVQRMDAIMPWESTTALNFQIDQFNHQELKTSIREMFFTDLLLALMARDSPQMTATEVVAKQQILMRLLGPTFGRLISELFNPLIDRAFGLMLRAGALPQVPEVVLFAVQQGQGDIEVEYEGPLARAQKQDDATLIATGIETAIGLFGEAAGDVIKMDDAMKRMLQATGFPADLVRNDEEIAERRQQRIEAMKEAQQGDDLEQAARTAAEAAKAAPLMEAVDQGSAAQQRAA